MTTALIKDCQRALEDIVQKRLQIGSNLEQENLLKKTQADAFIQNRGESTEARLTALVYHQLEKKAKEIERAYRQIATITNRITEQIKQYRTFIIKTEVCNQEVEEVANILEETEKAFEQAAVLQEQVVEAAEKARQWANKARDAWQQVAAREEAAEQQTKIFTKALAKAAAAEKAWQWAEVAETWQQASVGDLRTQQQTKIAAETWQQAREIEKAWYQEAKEMEAKEEKAWKWILKTAKAWAMEMGKKK